MTETAIHPCGITREEFEMFEEVRSSGITNMYAGFTIEHLTGIPRERQTILRNNYEALERFYRKS